MPLPDCNFAFVLGMRMRDQFEGVEKGRHVRLSIASPVTNTPHDDSSNLLTHCITHL